MPAGKLAAVVTCLEMWAPPTGRSDTVQPGITLDRVERPDVAWYRDLYSRIGTEWLWASRLAMAEGDLAAILHHPDVEVYAVMKDGRSEGLLELDFREEGACELAFFGLTAATIGNGTGRWLMN
ncbi:MAG: GNAT family N-acetyltransferase, partial [Shinella sp.]